MTIYYDDEIVKIEIDDEVLIGDLQIYSHCFTYFPRLILDPRTPALEKH